MNRNGWTGSIERLFKAGGVGLTYGVLVAGLPSAIIGSSSLGWQIAVLTSAIGSVTGAYLGSPVTLLVTNCGIIVGLWAGAVAKLVHAGARWWVVSRPGWPRPQSASVVGQVKRFGSWPVAVAVVSCLGAFFLVAYYIAHSGEGSTIPAAYQPYFPRGRIAPTGDASLDYWLNANIALDLVENQVIRMDEYHQPNLLRIMVNSIRQQPVTGVDTDLLTWAGLVVDLLEARAVILDRRTDSGTAGRPAALPTGADVRHQQLSRWERNHDRLAREGRALRVEISRRHGREFPPCLLGSPDIQPAAQ